MEQMAELKAEVLERARDAVVVNADDPLCVAMLTRGPGPTGTFWWPPTRQPIRWWSISRAGVGGDPGPGRRTARPRVGRRRRYEPFCSRCRTSAAMAGLLRYNVRNAMFAAALAWAQGIDPATIRHALGTFTASVAHNPGRFNFLDGFPFQVFLDYAHNPAGAVELSRVVAELPVTGRRIVCNTHVGNRHPSHLELVVPVLADAFDVFVLSCSPEELFPEYAAGGAGGSGDDYPDLSSYSPMPACRTVSPWLRIYSRRSGLRCASANRVTSSSCWPRRKKCCRSWRPCWARPARYPLRREGEGTRP